MIYSPSRKFVFIHLPKTGGTAFTLAYEHRARKDDLLFGDTPKARKRQRRFHRETGLRLKKHSKFSELIAACPDVNWSDITLTAISRNPWDRMVSYYHWSRAQSFDHPTIQAAKMLSFTDFVLSPLVQSTFEQHPFQSYLYHDLPVGPKVRILRQEHLQMDAAAWAQELGFRLPALGRVNQSDRPTDYRALYTPQTATIIERLFAYEVRALSYGFQE